MHTSGSGDRELTGATDEFQNCRGAAAATVVRLRQLVLREETRPLVSGANRMYGLHTPGAVMPTEGGVTGRDFRKYLQ